MLPEYDNLYDMVGKNAAKYPNKKYIFFKDKVYRYKEAREIILKTANVLSRNGVVKGDRVAMMLGNSPEFVFAYFGIVHLGAIAVPVNTFLKPREVANNLHDCEASYFITSEAFKEVADALPGMLDSLKTIFVYDDVSFDAVNIYKTDAPAVPLDVKINKYDDVSTLIYTSGTTGKPKGVMLTHRNVLANARSVTKRISTTDKDRFLAMLPLFHSFAFMTCIFCPLDAGGSMIILESILEATKKSYKTMLMTKRPSILVGVPQLYSAMAKMKINWLQKLLFPFRAMASGGSSLPSEVLRRFNQTYGKPVLEGYGLSEASPVVTFNPLEKNKQKPGTVGVALPDVEVKVVDADDKTLPADTPGELCVRGENVMKGYWNQPEETAKVLRDGWLHTGDLATMDEEGYVTIVDRIKDLIITKGINVYPSEVEDLLHSFPGVDIVSVIGIPAHDGNEVVVAYIKPEEGKTVGEKELKAFAAKNLASYKVPRKVVFTNELPITASGKVLKKELRAIALKQLSKDKDLE